MCQFTVSVSCGTCEEQHTLSKSQVASEGMPMRRFEDITQQLGDFQKATEQLKKQMKRAAASDSTQLLEHTFLSPQQLLAAEGPNRGWLDAEAPPPTLLSSQSRLPEGLPETVAAQHAQQGHVAEADSALAAAEMSRDVLEKGESERLQQQGSRVRSALQEDELAEFSAETQALLRQIHAISI